MPPSSNPNKKVANSLVAISSAAVLTVYAAGFVRTKAAAERFAELSSDSRPRRAPTPTAAPQILEASLNTAPPMPAPTEAKPAPKAIADKPASPASSEVAPTSAPTQVAVVTPAAPVAPAPPAAPLTPGPPWKDGTWKGWGNCRHGDIQAAVVVDGGKITSATISDCQTRYSCDVIDKLPPEVVKRQTADVDRVGGATQSADAFYFAVYEALRQSNEAAKADAAGAPPASAAPVSTRQAN
jgi:uncharacterized protein with FMN-binding domain